MWMMRTLAVIGGSVVPSMGGRGILVVGAVVVVVGYVLSLLLHPYTRCGTCKGSPRHYGSIFKRAFRLCSACGGSGRERRLGARLLKIGSS